MSRILRALSFLSLIFIPTLLIAQETWHFKFEEVNALHSKPADTQIAYGSDTRQYADLRLPSGTGPFPVVIIIHGGCWLSSVADEKNTAALADALRDQGYATLNVQYRGEDVTGGGYPGTFLDVAAAADYLPKIAEKYSLDLKRVAVIGHSAGGHLALWLAARDKIASSSPLYTEHPLKIRAVISLGGVPDLQAFRDYGKQVCGSDVIGNLLGTTPEEITQHYQDASPVNLLPLSAPQILLYGSDDIIVPLSYGETYIAEAKKKGGTALLFNLPYAGHHEYNVPNSVAWSVIIEQLRKLLG